MRKKIVAGNWKMNFSYHEALAYYATLLELKEEFPNNVEVLIFPPAVYIKEFTKKSTNGSLAIGAQNCAEFESGSYTGELSATMIKSLGAKYCILGHSERRNLFQETDEIIAKKIKIALTVSLNVIFCCGESEAERESGDYLQRVEEQVSKALFSLTAEELKKIVIAYEPVWAIGTGKTATADQAQEMHAHIRACIAKQFGTESAAEIRILYGGSCTPENAPQLFSCPDVDGGLIGGASLKAATFLPIIKAAH